MGFRVERVNSEMKKVLCDIVSNRIKDPRVSEMVSVLEVNVAKDLKTAKAYVSIYGDKDKIESTLDGLNKCAGFIRKELSIEFKDLRVVPQITFILDTSMDYSQKINTIIQEIKQHENN